MSRFIRVRATHPQGCYRAGIFHGIEPVTYDKTDLTPDQIRLLHQENGRMLLVDEIDDANAPLPNAGAVAASETFTSHPTLTVEEVEAIVEGAKSVEAERDAATAEADASRAEAETAKTDLAAAQAEAEALRAEIATLKEDAAAAKPKARTKPKPKAEAVDKGTDPAAMPLDGAAAVEG